MQCQYFNDDQKQCTSKAAVRLQISGHTFPLCMNHNVFVKTMTAKDKMLFGNCYIEIIKDRNHETIGVRYKSVKHIQFNETMKNLNSLNVIPAGPSAFGKIPARCVYFLEHNCKRTGGRCTREVTGSCRFFKEPPTDVDYTNKNHFYGADFRKGVVPRQVDRV